jgi:DNA-binding CsgD family transcriptional regulator
MNAPQKSHGGTEIGSRGAVKQKTELETKNERLVYPRRHPHGPAKTSARAIARKQREAEVLNYRVQGHSYQAIAEQMHIPASTAYEYAIRAMARIVPVEQAQEVLRMELARLDAMEAAIFDQAAHGEYAAIEACLKISNQRARLLGLYPAAESKPTLNLNIGGNPVGNAEDTGIEVRFVRATKWLNEDTDKKLLGPVIDHSQSNGGGSKP